MDAPRVIHLGPVRPAPPGAPGALIVALSVLLIALASLPLVLGTPLNLVDVPNHAARLHVISQGATTPHLLAAYEIDWHFLPNLAIDLIGPPLARAFGAEAAMLWLVVLALALQVTGVVAVHRTLFQRWSVVPLGVGLLLYNRAFDWGFVNYLIATGAAFCVFAVWLRLQDLALFWRAAIGLLLVTALAPLHLMGFGVAAVLIGSFELTRAWDLRSTPGAALARLLAGAVPFAPGLVLIALAPTTSIDTPVVFALSQKLAGLFAPFDATWRPLDVVTSLTIAALVVGLFATGRLVVHRCIALALVLLTALFAAMPGGLLGAGTVDLRLAPAVAMVGVMAVDWRIGSPRVRHAFVVVLAALFVGRVGAATAYAMEADRQYDALRAMWSQVEPGTSMAVIAVIPETPYPPPVPRRQIANIAVVDRDIFVNSVFAVPGHHTLRVVADVPAEAASCCQHEFVIRNRRDPSRTTTDVDPFTQRPLTAFDYVFVTGVSGLPSPAPAFLSPVAEGPDAMLYRVN